MVDYPISLVKRLVKGSPLTMADHDDNLTKLQEGMNDLADRYVDPTAINSRLDDLETSDTSQDTSINTAEGNIDGLDLRLDDLEDDNLDSRISSIESQGLDGRVNTNTSSIGSINTALAGKANTSHLHDDRYYTEAEINSKLALKSDSTHNHDDRYMTDAEVSSAIDDIDTEKLDTIIKIISGVNVVAICIHKVADDDDPDWIEKCGDTSWYNEQLNTSTRGKTRKFPAECLIVAESDTVTIYDLTDPDVPMWMVFDSDNNNMVRNSVTCVDMLGGELVVGHLGGPTMTNFPVDTGFLLYDDPNYTGFSKGVIAERNDALGFNWPDTLGRAVVNQNINDLAITLLPNAPINPATNMRYPTIAVATDGGVSIIDGPAGVGTVVDIILSEPGYTLSKSVTIFENSLYLELGSGAGHSWVYVFNALPSVDTSITINTKNGSPVSPDAWYDPRTTGVSPDLNLLQVSNDGGSDYITVGKGEYSGCTGGLSKLYPNPSQPSAGAVAYITNNYNTGLMRGDIQLATMCDTVSGSATGTITDRCVQGNDATITGTLTKSAVATGAELMGFSGFSASNYATIPYSSDFDFGTGDFHISCWVYTTAYGIGSQYFIEWSAPLGATRLEFYFTNEGRVALSFSGSIIDTPDVLALAQWHKVEIFRKNSLTAIVVNGVISSTGSSTLDLSDTSARIRLGIRAYNETTPYTNGLMALPHVSKTAPTPEQIKADYLAELPMFQENAKCTLSGSSNSVLALSYDDSKDEATVITDVTDTFNGLVNVKQASLTGTGQCVDSRHGVVAIGTSTQASVEKPEINLREELAKQAEAPSSPYSQVWFDGDASEKDFELPSGYNVWAVYNEGMLVKEGSADQYTITDNGINKVVSFNVAPANGNDICVMIYKENN